MLKSLFVAVVAMSFFIALMIQNIIKTQDEQTAKINKLEHRVNHWLPEVQPEGKR